MDVKSRIRLVTTERFEVSVDGMLCGGAENTHEETAEVLEAVRVIRQTKLAAMIFMVRV